MYCSTGLLGLGRKLYFGFRLRGVALLAEGVKFWGLRLRIDGRGHVGAHQGQRRVHHGGSVDGHSTSNPFSDIVRFWFGL